MSTAADFKPVLTKAFLALQEKKKAAPSFQALVFEEPLSSKKNSHRGYGEDSAGNPKFARSRPSKSTEDVEFDMKKVRHEVINFATQNQRVVKNKKKLEIMQLVKLGAKPPKKVCKNYKDLVEERKRLKQIRDERQKFHQLGKNQAGAASIKCRTKKKQESAKKKRAPVTDIDQHYGVAKSKLKRK